MRLPYLAFKAQSWITFETKLLANPSAVCVNVYGFFWFFFALSSNVILIFWYFIVCKVKRKYWQKSALNYWYCRRSVLLVQHKITTPISLSSFKNPQNFALCKCSNIKETNLLFVPMPTYWLVCQYMRNFNLNAQPVNLFLAINVWSYTTVRCRIFIILAIRRA